MRTLKNPLIRIGRGISITKCFNIDYPEIKEIECVEWKCEDYDPVNDRCTRYDLPQNTKPKKLRRVG